MEFLIIFELYELASVFHLLFMSTVPVSIDLYMEAARI